MVCAVSSSSCLSSCGQAARSERVWVAIGVILAIGGILGLVYGNLGMYSPVLSNGLITGGSLVTLIALFVLLRPGAKVLRRARNRIQRARPAPYRYSDGRVLVRQSDLRARPELHLDQLLQNMSSARSVDVRYYEENSTRQMRGNGGGPNRQYFTLLVKGVVQKYSTRFVRVDESGLMVPKANKEEDTRLFEQLGQLMMRCLQMEKKIGCHFDLSLFAVARALPADEVEVPFEQVNTFPLYRILLHAQNEHCMDAHLNLIEETNWSAAQQAQAKDLIEVVEDDFPTESDGRNRTYLEKYISDLCDPQLRGIHAVARGMQSIDPDFRGGHASHLEFCKAVQGSIERADVLRVLPRSISDHEANKKLQWIRQWISDPHTPIEDIQQFLLNVTGSSGVSGPISVASEDLPRHMMRIAQCSSSIELSSAPVGQDRKPPAPPADLEEQKTLFLEFFVLAIRDNSYNRG